MVKLSLILMRLIMIRQRTYQRYSLIYQRYSLMLTSRTKLTSRCVLYYCLYGIMQDCLLAARWNIAVGEEVVWVKGDSYWSSWLISATVLSVHGTEVGYPMKNYASLTCMCIWVFWHYKCQLLEFVTGAGATILFFHPWHCTNHLFPCNEFG